MRQLRQEVSNQWRNPLLRNAYALVLNSGTTSALGLLYWILAARLYSPDVVGISAALLTTMTFLAEASRFNLGSALVRFLPLAGASGVPLVRRVYAISLIGPAVILVASMVAPSWLAAVANIASVPDYLVLWFPLGIGAASILVLQDAALTGIRRSVWIPLENGLFGLAKVLLLLLFSRLLPVTGIFLSWVAPLLAVLVPANVILFKRLLPQHAAASAHDEAVPPALARYVTGDYFGNILYQATITILPLLIVRIAGPAMNAYFAQVWLIATSLQLITVNMTLSLTVEGSRAPERLGSLTGSVLRHALRLVGALAAITFAGAPLLLRAFGANYAAEGATLLRLLSVAAVAYAFIIVFIGVARVQRDIRGIVSVQAVLAVLSLSLSALLLPRMGINGVGVAWLASATIVAAPLYWRRLRPLLRQPEPAPYPS